MTLPPPKDSYKTFLWDYDDLLTRSDEECCYSLSEREVQILLAQLDPISWKTRYQPTSTEIDQSLILHWRGNLARKLMSGCCPDDETLSRFTEDGIFQTSEDGGETWTDNPGADPRNDAVGAPPLPGTGESTKCASADNARDYFKSIRDQMISLLEAGTTILAIIAGLIGALGVLAGLTGVGVGISVLLFGMAAGLLSLTPEEVAEQIDDEALETFKCILFCHMEENGQFTYANWVLVLADIDDQFTGFPHEFFHGLVAAMGYISLSNAGTIGAATADDCDCGCEPEGCNSHWEVEFGTLLGEFDGYIRVQSVVDGGRSKITMLTPDANTCCTLLDIRVLEPEGVSPFVFGVHIDCGLPQIFENLSFSLTLGGCINYIGTQLAATDTRDYVVEFLFADCP